MKFTFKQLFIMPNFKKRFAFMFTAITMMGLTLSVLIEVGFGTDPCSFANLNISHNLGIGLGTGQLLVFGIMFIFEFIFGPELIGLGSIFNMCYLGYVADFGRWFCAKIGFVDYLQICPLAITIIIFAVFIFLFVVSVAVYANSKMGISSFDSIPKMISDRLPNVPFWLVRMAYDFFFFGVGLVVGICSKDGIQGSVIGSIVIAFFLGPAISFVGKKLEKIVE